jgi:hypothetical protein
MNRQLANAPTAANMYFFYNSPSFWLCDLEVSVVVKQIDI